MTTFEYVEDYVQFIVGLRDLSGRVGHLWDAKPVIKLANYDINPLNSFAMQITSLQGFTDRQATLAINIIRKYERQLAKHGVSIAGIDEPKFRIPIRKVDRSRSLTFDGDRFYLKFPFNSEMVDSVREFAQISKGSVKFDKDSKSWVFAPTEDCLNFAHAFATLKEFEIADNVRDLYALLNANEIMDYRIELRSGPDGLMITNAPAALVEYVNEHLGGFGFDNRARLVDAAPTLGITVADELLDDLLYTYYATKTEIRVVANKQSLEDLAKYAINYQRFPIYVLGDAHFSDRDGDLTRYFAPHEVVRCYSKDDHLKVNDQTRVIYLLSQTRDLIDYVPDRIPLLVSYSNMLFGMNKSILLQRADKICYYCDAHLPTKRTKV